MNVSPQPSSRSTRLRDLGAPRVDISTLETREIAAVGGANQASMQRTNDKAGSTKLEAQQWARKKKRKTKKFYLFTLILLIVCITASVATVIGYETYDASYRRYTSLAQTGVQHLRTAATLLETLPKNPFDAPVVGRARQEFVAASTAFVQLGVGLKSLPGIITLIPVYGSRLSAALHLAPLAVEVAQAGVVSCDALSLLITRFHNPLNVGQGLTMADLTVLTQDLHHLKATFKLVVQQVDALRPGDLQFDPHLGQMVTTFHRELPVLQTGLDQAEQFLSVAPALLGVGTPTNYLIEMLDSTELRPGGGFIGNYGTATLSGGRLTSAHITDVYLFDWPFEAAGHSIPYPPAYSWFDLASGSWSLRDSNLDADFPTAARYAEQNYKLEGGNIPVQGVIAITPALIQQALTVVGPIDIPEYNETVTAQNLIELIHYHQLGAGRQGDDTPSPDGHSSVRKHFTELLAEHFLARVHQLPASALPKLLQVLISSLHSKDLQVYLNSGAAENLLQRYHIDASIQSPPADSLFVVDANISPSKANQFITNAVNDQVTIDAYGNAIHHATISYAWLTSGPIYGASLYRDYVRVYVPPGSFLQMQGGWQPRGTSRAFGREVWAGLLTLSYGQTRTITLIWTVPHAATKGTGVWHYRYLIQRQAGSHWTWHLQLTLPACARITNKLGGLASRTKQVAEFIQPLNEDSNIGLDYAC